MRRDGVALFPLNSVLFPGGLLPLQIFEARYLDMVSDCMRNDKEFGVCLISDGRETGHAASIVPVGTFARISDWTQLDNGLLGITATGTTRFSVVESTVRSDQLVVAVTDDLDTETAQAINDDHRSLAALLKQLRRQLGGPFDTIPGDFKDAGWVSYRLAEILPVPLNKKQHLLELTDTLARLNEIHELIQLMAEEK